jgi:dTDP-6-deoxy-L-talose 4-dehydrogenase (NAD+)
MTKLVLLTGASGFVGRQVLRALAEKDIRVRPVIRQGTKVPAKYPSLIDKVIETRDLFAEPASFWASACEGVDTIIHTAWYAEPGKYLESPKNFDCLKGTLEMAQGAVKACVRRFVGIGTCFEYDLEGGRLSIETPLNPLTPYAQAKADAFRGLSKSFSAARVEFAWCRLFYLYGEGEDDRRLVPFLRKKLAAGETADLTSGKQIRDFLDVRDAGGMIVDASLSHTQGAINICSGVPITVRQLAEQIADEYGRRDLLRFGVRPDNLIDPPCVVGVKTKVEHLER